MRRSKWVALELCVGALALLAFSGCAAPGSHASIPDVKPLREDRAKEAVEEFEARRNEAEYQAALGRFQEGDVEGCLQQVQAVLDRAPQHRPSRLLLSEVYLSMKRPDRALAVLEQLVQDDPNAADAHYALATTLDVLGRHEEALMGYERATQLAPSNKMFQESYQAAVEALSDPDELANNDVMPAAFDADVESTSEETDIEAVSHEEEAVKFVSVSDPADEQPDEKAVEPAPQEERRSSRRVKRGRKASETTEQTPTGSTHAANEDAVTTDGEATSAAPASETSEQTETAVKPEENSVESVVSLAAAALQSRQPDQALQIADAGLLRFPDSPVLHRIAGAAHLELGEYEEAEAELSQSIDLDSSSAVSYFLLGRAREKLGRPEDARASYEKAERLDPRYKVND